MLRITLSSISDAVITTDIKGLVTFLNPVAQFLIGWTQADALGVPLEKIFKIVNEETRHTVENPATRALREGKVVGLANHTLLITNDGKEKSIGYSAAPIHNANGEVVGAALVFRDITEVRLQEQLLQDTVNYAEAILATLREPFIVLDHNLRIKTANRSFYETFKVLPKETEDKFIYDLGNAQWDLPELRTLLKEVLSNDHPIHDFEVEQTFPGIGHRVMRLNAARLASVNSQPDLILLAIEDITDRHNAEIAMRNSEMRFRRLFETAKDGILILESNTGKITEANPFISELLGFPTDELLGKELWQIGLFQDIEASRAAFRQLQEKGYIRYHNLPLVTKAGQRVEVEFVSNLYRVDHQPVIQCNIRDNTEHQQLERAQARAEALVELHRRKDEFLAMLSHELRNPLSAITNAVEILDRQNDEPTQQKARTIIRRQVGHLVVLVNDLLEVTRVLSGRIQLHQEELDLRGIVQRALETTRDLFEQRKHELNVTLPEEPVWLMGDALRLEEVIVNLLNNAAKYTPEGGHVSLSLNKEGEDAVVRVKDTGVGIGPDLLPQVFDLFTQAKRTLDRSQGGLGVGLTVVRKLVEMHGGTTEAHSSGLGQGSEFIVRLPILLSPLRRDTVSSAERAQSTQAWRVLVVDDNVDSADSIASLLESSGHDVKVAYSAEKALEMATDYQPEIMLLDIGLPEMDGYEVAKRLRQNPQLKDLRLIALTGYGQDSDRQRSREAGFDAHVVKPVDWRNLSELLESLMKRQSRSG
ncbi:MAG TPA: PAS domain S-box protein [Pyrinomonadaceae bacterium]